MVALALVTGLGVAALPLVAFAQASTFSVELAEFSIKASPSNVPAGTVNFAVKNAGANNHELVVVRSSAAPGSLPLNATNSLDEAQVQVVKRMDRLASGASGSLGVDLTPGSYILLCNIGTHYQRGMNLAFTVTAAGGATGGTAAQVAPPKSGSGGYLDGGRDMTLWALGALAVVAAGVALAAGVTTRRREH